MRRLLLLLTTVVVVLTGAVLAPSAAADVYTTPGIHNVNGRQWKTECKPYSSTVERCFTDIMAVTVVREGGRYVEKRMWVFNNLTYKTRPRADWSFMNPLVTPGDHIIDGRKWRTECDTAWTGGGGCRSQILATVIEKNPRGGYESVNKYIFNNIVHVGAIPCVVPQTQVRTDTKIPTTVTQGCTRSAHNNTWVAVDFPVALQDGYRYMSTAFYRQSGGVWQYKVRSGANLQVCSWANDNGAPRDLVAKHLPFCNR